MAAFSTDIGFIFAEVLARSDLVPSNNDNASIAELHHGLDGPAADRHTLTTEQKEVRKVTKRIVKAIKQPLEAALKKEAELKRIPFEKEMNEWAKLDARLDQSLTNPSRPSITAEMTMGDTTATAEEVSATGGASPNSRGSGPAESQDVSMAEVGDATEERPKWPGKKTEQHTHPLSPPVSASPTALEHAPSLTAYELQHPSAPSLKATGSTDSWSHGGVPWYLAPWDIVGTTTHDERWTGMEQMRAMSEALSEMDEDTLRELDQSNHGGSAPPADDDLGLGDATAQKTKRSPTKRDATAPAKSTPAKSRASRGRAGSKTSIKAVEQEEERGETEKERHAREKREEYNAKRRAQRRKSKGVW